MEKVFILKTIDFEQVSCSNLLGKRFFKVQLTSNNPIPDILKDYLKPYVDKADERGDVLNMPMFQVYIIGEDGEIFPLDNSVHAYITCNGTTVEKINIPKGFMDPQEWSKFWCGILDASNI